MGNASRSITIAFQGATGPDDVTLTIKDYCTDIPIPGAQVTLSSGTYPSSTKTADVNGQVTFLQVPSGNHNLSVTASGYIPSNSDTLANDSISV